MIRQDRYRAAESIARDAVDRDVLTDMEIDAVRSDELMLLLASAARDLDLSVTVDGADSAQPALGDLVDDAETLARWRARNLLQQTRSGGVET